MIDYSKYSLLGSSHPFKSQFPGTCNIDRDHRYRIGSWVAKVQRSDNPMIQLQGVACPECTKEIRKGVDIVHTQE